jgi:hypothetical protein
MPDLSTLPEYLIAKVRDDIDVQATARIKSTIDAYPKDQAEVFDPGKIDKDKLVPKNAKDDLIIDKGGRIDEFLKDWKTGTKDYSNLEFTSERQALESCMTLGYMAIFNPGGHARFITRTQELKADSGTELLKGTDQAAYLLGSFKFLFDYQIAQRARMVFERTGGFKPGVTDGTNALLGDAEAKDVYVDFESIQAFVSRGWATFGSVTDSLGKKQADHGDSANAYSKYTWLSLVNLMYKMDPDYFTKLVQGDNVLRKIRGAENLKEIISGNRPVMLGKNESVTGLENISKSIIKKFIEQWIEAYKDRDAKEIAKNLCNDPDDYVAEYLVSPPPETDVSKTQFTNIADKFVTMQTRFFDAMLIDKVPDGASPLSLRSQVYFKYRFSPSVVKAILKWYYEIDTSPEKEEKKKFGQRIGDFFGGAGRAIKETLMEGTGNTPSGMKMFGKGTGENWKSGFLDMFPSGKDKPGDDSSVSNKSPGLESEESLSKESESNASNPVESSGPINTPDLTAGAMSNVSNNVTNNQGSSNTSTTINNPTINNQAGDVSSTSNQTTNLNTSASNNFSNLSQTGSSSVSNQETSVNSRLGDLSESFKNLSNVSKESLNTNNLSVGELMQAIGVDGESAGSVIEALTSIQNLESSSVNNSLQNSLSNQLSKVSNNPEVTSQVMSSVNQGDVSGMVNAVTEGINNVISSQTNQNNSNLTAMAGSNSSETSSNVSNVTNQSTSGSQSEAMDSTPAINQLIADNSELNRNIRRLLHTFSSPIEVKITNS